MKRFLTALGFLTTIPGPFHASLGIEELGRAAVWFPLVGALIGGLVTLIQIGLDFFMTILLCLDCKSRREKCNGGEDIRRQGPAAHREGLR